MPRITPKQFKERIQKEPWSNFNNFCTKLGFPKLTFPSKYKDFSDFFNIGTDQPYELFKNALKNVSLANLKKDQDVLLTNDPAKYLTIELFKCFATKESFYETFISPDGLDFQKTNKKFQLVFRQKHYSSSGIAHKCFDPATNTISEEKVMDAITLIFKQSNCAYKIDPWFVKNICEQGSERMKKNETFPIPIVSAEFKNQMSKFLSVVPYSAQFLNFLKSSLNSTYTPNDVKPWIIPLFLALKNNPLLFLEMHSNILRNPKARKHLEELLSFIEAYFSCFTNEFPRKLNRKANLFTLQDLHFKQKINRNGILNYYKVIVVYTSRSFFYLDPVYYFYKISYLQIVENLLCYIMSGIDFPDQAYKTWDPNLISHSDPEIVKQIEKEPTLKRSIYLYSILYFLFEKKKFDIEETPEFDEDVNSLFKKYMAMPLFEVNFIGVSEEQKGDLIKVVNIPKSKIKIQLKSVKHFTFFASVTEESNAFDIFVIIKAQMNALAASFENSNIVYNAMYDLEFTFSAGLLVSIVQMDDGKIAGDNYRNMSMKYSFPNGFSLTDSEVLAIIENRLFEYVLSDSVSSGLTRSNHFYHIFNNMTITMTGLTLLAGNVQVKNRFTAYYNYALSSSGFSAVNCLVHSTLNHYLDLNIDNKTRERSTQKNRNTFNLWNNTKIDIQKKLLSNDYVKELYDFITKDIETNLLPPDKSIFSDIDKIIYI